MLTVCKSFAFSASHQLAHLPEDHPCARLHGHNYTVAVEIAADAVSPSLGFVLDFRELDGFKRWIDDRLDHRHLNDVVPALAAEHGVPGLTTSEHLAALLYHVAAGFVALRSAVAGGASASGLRILAVRVSETPKTWAEYRPAAPAFALEAR